MTNISASEVINEDVGSLIKRNQSNNETNLVRSLNISTTTDTSSHTTTDDKIFGEVVEQSSKKKTFGVYKTKQVVEDITPEVNTPISDVVNQVPTNEVASLTNKTGVVITNDQGYAKAVKEANIATAESVSNSYSAMGNVSISPSTIYTVSDDGRLTNVMKKVSSATVTSKSPALDGVYPISPTLEYASNNLELPEGDVSEVKQEYPINFTDNATLRSYVPDTMTAEEYESARSIVNGPLKSEINCPDMLEAFDFGLDLSMIGDMRDSLMSMLDLGIDVSFLSCFDNVYDQLGVHDKMNMLGKVTGNGDIAAMDQILGQVSPNMFQSPGKDVLSLGNKYKATKDSAGKKRDFSLAENTVLMDSILGKTGVPKADLLSTKTSASSKNKSVGDTIPIVDMASVKGSNKSNGFLEYILGRANARLLTSLPT